MSVTHSAAVRVAFANVKTGQTNSFNAGSNQKLIIYSGTAPANASTALSGNTAVSTLTNLVWGTPNASTGATSLSATADSNAVGGTASFYRITESDGVTVIEQGTVGTSGADLTINSAAIASGATVSLSSGTYTPTP